MKERLIYRKKFLWSVRCGKQHSGGDSVLGGGRDRRDGCVRGALKSSRKPLTQAPI